MALSEMIIPIFDMLAHPTMSGRWLGQKVDASFERLAQDLRSANFSGACAIGLHGVEGYDHELFVEACGRFPELVPVAGFDPHVPDPESDCAFLRRLGYRGIKIHPRFSAAPIDKIGLSDILAAARKSGLVTFICTYFHDRAESYPTADPMIAIVAALREVPDARVVLVHGGDVNLLRYAELVRHNENLLLDLSLTLMKYEGSSIDNDISFLFHKFDRRICIGSDHPEWSHDAVRKRVEHFGQGLADEKFRNLAYRNAMRFLGLAVR